MSSDHRSTTLSFVAPLLAAALVAMSSACTVSAAKVGVKPMHVHLGLEGAATTSVTVTWRSTTSRGVVHYGVGEQLKQRQAAHSRSYHGGFIHEARLQGLKPATTYTYRCGEGKNLSPAYSFRTAPAPGGTAPLRFVAMGDSRTNDVARRKVVAAALATKPAFLLHTGDLIADGYSQGQWDRWFATMEPIAARAPMLVAIGNHEKNAPHYFKQLALPTHGEWRAQGYEKEAFYSIDYGPMHIIALSTEPVGSPTGPQARWLMADLAAARKNPTTRWIIVMGHRPPISCGSHGDHIPAKRAWTALFEKHGVDLTLWGHDHNYQRTKPLRRDKPVAPGKGVVYVVTGGAGAPLYGANPDARMAATKRAYHFMDITVTQTKLQVEVRGVDGKSLDSFELVKPAK